MRGHLIFLVTSFAASVVAAPVPVSPESPVESAGPLMAREANEGVISPVLDTMKREILERLDAIMERTVPGIDPSDVKNKRDTMWKDLKVTTGQNDKRDGIRTDGVASSLNNKRDDIRTDGVASSLNNKRDDIRTDGVASSLNNKRDGI